MSDEPKVLIVGGGWAGMAAALELDSHGIPFTLLESAPQLGGRARSVTHGKWIVDNGQHLLIGAYQETLRQLKRMGIDEEVVLARESLRLRVQEQGKALMLSTPPLPAPLHLAWAIISAKGINRHDKRHALRMSLSLSLSGFSLDEDISVAALLARHRQGPDLIRRFWEPLCIATLNTPLEKASAQVFLRVLRDSFSRRRRDADLLIPKVPLGALFPEAAANYLKRRQADNPVRLRYRVNSLHIKGDCIRGIDSPQGNIEAETVILATSPSAATRLLNPHPSLQRLADRITRLGSQPIITAYLQFPVDFRLQQTMVGLSGRLAQWLFDRSICSQPGLVAVIISAEGEHCHWDNEKLLDRLQTELKEEFPHWPTVESAWVIREKRATFECRTGIEPLRPGNATPVKGLWLAGDYTDTGYPATLEGAVLSGVQCARRLIQERLFSD
jgi:squalene-associated FAD-dependent desaturase